MDISSDENLENESVVSTEINQYESHETGVKSKCSKREEIIESFIEQICKRHFLINKNRSLQQILAFFVSGSSEKEYFSNLIFSEEADEWVFRKLLDNIALKEDELNDTSKKHLTEIQSLKEEISKKREAFIELTSSFKQETERAALKAVHSETGECLSVKDVQALLTREEEVSKTLQEYQSYSIQRKEYLNLAMGKKKNLAEGPIDFAKYEILCIETQNMKEIIQPLSEEIKNIMKKASNIINVLSHMGQKLYLSQEEKAKASSTEKKLEKELNEMRDQLFTERMKYTRMKHESKELQHKFMLLQHPKLIEDYNEVQRENEKDQEELQRLKKTYEDEIKILNTKSTHKL